MHDCDGDGDDHLPSPLLINLTHEHILNAKTTDVGCPSACTAKESKTSGQTRPPFPSPRFLAPAAAQRAPRKRVCGDHPGSSLWSFFACARGEECVEKSLYSTEYGRSLSSWVRRLRRMTMVLNTRVYNRVTGLLYILRGRDFAECELGLCAG
jgi:hypothetical protein